MKGRSVPLSRPRRFVADLMYFAAGVPTVPVQRRMRLAPLVAARAAAADRPPWAAVFAKGFALVAREVPDLRRAYVKLPWPRLYEYRASVAGVAVERQYDGGPAVLVGHVRDPAGLPLAEVARRVRGFAEAPVDRVKGFRRQMRLSGLPRPVRRLAWWLGLNLPRTRGNLFGTFGVTAYSGLGAESLHPLSPLTATLTYGVIAPDGTVDVRVVYDHRVTDGATVARALARLEQVLNRDVAGELSEAAALAAKLVTQRAGRTGPAGPTRNRPQP